MFTETTRGTKTTRTVASAFRRRVDACHRWANAVKRLTPDTVRRVLDSCPMTSISDDSSDTADDEQTDVDRALMRLVVTLPPIALHSRSRSADPPYTPSAVVGARNNSLAVGGQQVAHMASLIAAPMMRSMSCRPSLTSVSAVNPDLFTVAAAELVARRRSRRQKKKKKTKAPPTRTKMAAVSSAFVHLKRRQNRRAPAIVKKWTLGEPTSGIAQSFRRLLANEIGRQEFERFLKREFSEENLFYWKACEDLLMLKASPPEQGRLALDIYKTFIADEAPLPINIDCGVKRAISTEVQRYTARLAAPTVQRKTKGREAAVLDVQPFVNAQIQVYLLMERDSFGRFVKTDVYRSLAVLLVDHDLTYSASTERRLSRGKMPRMLPRINV